MDSNSNLSISDNFTTVNDTVLENVAEEESNDVEKIQAWQWYQEPNQLGKKIIILRVDFVNLNLKFVLAF